MKTVIHSLLFIIIVALFSITSDKLSKIEQKNMIQQEASSKSSMSDREFINGMIEHHEGAVSMAKEALVKSKRAELRTFAQNIITAQTTEIEQMYSWRKNWFNDSSHIEMRMGMDMPSMAIDLGKADAEFDKRFLLAMIEHHQGAVIMAKQVLLPTDRTEIHDLAKNIVTTQEEEILMMQQYLKEWYE